MFGNGFECSLPFMSVNLFSGVSGRRRAPPPRVPPRGAPCQPGGRGQPVGRSQALRAGLESLLQQRALQAESREQPEPQTHGGGGGERERSRVEAPPFIQHYSPPIIKHVDVIYSRFKIYLWNSGRFYRQGIVFPFSFFYLSFENILLRTTTLLKEEK